MTLRDLEGLAERAGHTQSHTGLLVADDGPPERAMGRGLTLVWRMLLLFQYLE